MKVARTKHLYDQIHLLLWEKILNGEISQSQRLKDVEWAKELGVSRTPVREAMRKMEQEGILIALDQGGYKVRTVEPADFAELYRCRAALEALAAREAAERWMPSNGKTLTLLLNQAEIAIDSGDLDKLFDLNTDFHQALIGLSQNNHLISLCNNLRKLVVFYRSTRLNEAKLGEEIRAEYVDRLTEELSEHREILEAVSERRADDAEKLMEKHILDTAAMYS